MLRFRILSEPSGVIHERLFHGMVPLLQFKNLWLMVTRHNVISSRWSSHFCVKMHVFSTFVNNKSKACGWPFIAILTWVLILGKIQDGSQGGYHFCWRHRPPVAPPPIKYTSSCRGDQRLSTKGKIVSKYCNILKTLGSTYPSLPPFPCTTVEVWINVYVRGLTFEVTFHASLIYCT